MSRLPWLIPIGAALLVVAIVWVAVGSGWTAAIPDGAASTVVARAELGGAIAPDASRRARCGDDPTLAGRVRLPPADRAARRA